MTTCTKLALALAGPVAEQVLLLENIATSIQTGPNQLPTIHNLLLEAVSSNTVQAYTIFPLTTHMGGDRTSCAAAGLA